MLYGEFETLIGRLTLYYNKSWPEEKQLKIWHEKCQSVPQMASDGVFNWITDNYESMPRNIGIAIRVAFDQWKSSNPNKVYRDYAPCQVCQNTGLLYSKKYDEECGYTVEFVSRCAMCNNSLKHFAGQTIVMATTPQYLRDNGYEIIVRDVPEILKDE